jgi:hypothetical protein
MRKRPLIATSRLTRKVVSKDRNRRYPTRVGVSDCPYPRFDVNPNTGDPLGDYRRMVPADNTVYHDAAHPSHVVLPVVPGR